MYGPFRVGKDDGLAGDLLVHVTKGLRSSFRFHLGDIRDDSTPERIGVFILETMVYPLIGRSGVGTGQSKTPSRFVTRFTPTYPVVLNWFGVTTGTLGFGQGLQRYPFIQV